MAMQEVVIELMGADFVLWRCLHGGPLTRSSIEQWKEGDSMPWEELRARDVPLLRILISSTALRGMPACISGSGWGSSRWAPRSSPTWLKITTLREPCAKRQRHRESIRSACSTSTPCDGNWCPRGCLDN